MKANSFRGQSILVVEDEPLIALDMLSALRTAGANAIGAATLNDALQIAGRTDLAAAVLDFNVHGADVSGICTKLEQSRIPFMFYSGYGAQVFRRWPHALVIGKPASMEAMVTALASLLPSQAGCCPVGTRKPSEPIVRDGPAAAFDNM